MEDGIPRRGHEPDPMTRIMNLIRQLRSDVDSLQRGSTLRNASVSGGDGLQVLDEAGETLLALTTQDGGGVIAYDPSGIQVARFGPLFNSAPGEYGVEVLVEGGWVRLGYQSTSWGTIGGIPSAYDPVSKLWDPTPHTHPGSQVTSAVGEAVHAAQADGSQWGWTNAVAGTEFYALWVGNDGGFHLGRNVSSIKYKQNVTPATGDPKRVLKLAPVRYDRKPTEEVLPDGTEGPRRVYPGRRGEYGLIAEETYPHVPEVVTFHDGEIDGIRYDLLSVALVPCLQAHEDEINQLKRQNAEQQAQIDALIKAVQRLGGTV